MENNKFVLFLKNNLGFIIGLLLGIVVVVCRVTEFFVNLLIMICFGVIGSYIQRNKAKVKDTLKKLIDKM